MNDARCSLVACACRPPLQDLLVGTASKLGLDFRELACVSEVLNLANLPPIAIVVIEVGDLSDSLLMSVEGLSSSPRFWPALVTIDASEENHVVRAMAAGAIACMSHQTAIQAIPYLIRIILSRTSHDVDFSPGRLSVGGDVVLTVPGHTLTDGERESALPPIPGGLLEGLARHPDCVVSFDELKRHGWGMSSGVTDHAVRERMSCLRTRLEAFDLERKIRCCRGRGYMLERDFHS